MGTNKSQYVFKSDFKSFFTKHYNCLQDLILLLLTSGGISCGHHLQYMSHERVANWRVRHKSISPQVHMSTPKSQHKMSELKEKRGEERQEEFTKKRPPAARKAARHDDDLEELGRGGSIPKGRRGDC